MTVCRRQFFAFGAAGFLPYSGTLFYPSETRKASIFPHAFGGSRTVSAFASCLAGDMSFPPEWLSRAVDIELSRESIPPDSFETERLRARFFAWFAIRCIAPRHLRRAGYSSAAIECEQQTDLGKGGSAAAGARCTIGWNPDGLSGPNTPLKSIAYGTAAHTSTAAHYATLDNIEHLKDTGRFCAEALTQPIFHPDDGPEYTTDPIEASWVWSAGVYAINVAMTIDAPSDS